MYLILDRVIVFISVKCEFYGDKQVFFLFYRLNKEVEEEKNEGSDYQNQFQVFDVLYCVVLVCWQIRMVIIQYIFFYNFNYLG